MLKQQDANERIERLERRLRLQTRGLIVFGVLAAAASLLFGQSPSMRTVEAEKFILRGPQGKELGSLTGDDRGATLTLYDGQHRQKVTVRSGTGMSAVAITDSDEKANVTIGAGDAGALVSVQGSDLKSNASIGVLDNAPNFQLHDQEGRIRGEFGMTETGPMMRAYGSSPEIRTAAGVAGDAPTIAVGGPDKGSVMISAGLTRKKGDTGGTVVIFKPDGKTVAWRALP